MEARIRNRLIGGCVVVTSRCPGSAIRPDYQSRTDVALSAASSRIYAYTRPSAMCGKDGIIFLRAGAEDFESPCILDFI